HVNGTLCENWQVPRILEDQTEDSTPCRGLCSNLDRVLSDPLSADSHNRDPIGDEWRVAYDATLEHDRSTKRYTVGLPWDGKKRPASNASSAKGFAYHMREVLRQNGQLEAYTDVIREL